MLLRCDRYCSDVFESPCRRDGCLDGAPPLVGVDLRARRAGSASLPYESTCGPISDYDLASLSRGVDPRNEIGHHLAGTDSVLDGELAQGHEAIGDVGCGLRVEIFESAPVGEQSLVALAGSDARDGQLCDLAGP